MSMFQYSLNASTIRTTPLLDKIAIASEAGYSGIELWHDDIDAYLSAGGALPEIQDALINHNLAVPTTISLKGWCETTGLEHRRALDECQRRMEHAAALGAVHVIAGPPLGKVDHNLAAANYRELLELGIQQNIEPALEYLGFAEDINSIEAAVDILTKAGHASGTIVHDPFHIFRGGGSFESLTMFPASRIAVCHFNDAPASPPRENQHDPDRVMPGDGHIDLKRMVTIRKQIGYRGFVSLELFREDLWKRDPLEVARLGLERMRAIAED